MPASSRRRHRPSYDFWFQGQRYVGTTRQTTKSDAIVCEQEVRRRLPTGGRPRGVRRQPGTAVPGLGRGALSGTHPTHVAPRSFSTTTSGSFCGFGARDPSATTIPPTPTMTCASTIPFAIRSGSSGSKPGCGGGTPRRRHGIIIGRCSAGFTRPHSCPGIEP